MSEANEALSLHAPGAGKTQTSRLWQSFLKREIHTFVQAAEDLEVGVDKRAFNTCIGQIFKTWGSKWAFLPQNVTLLGKISL